ncbi:MAG: ABC transporter ATP-binding protein [Nitriliruptoraceae bacterium]
MTTDPPPRPVVVVDGLTKRFGAQLAVDEVTFTLPPGRVVGFLGPNGAGKSTTLRMMIGLTTPTAGSATFGGVPFHDLADPVRTVGTIVDGVEFHPGRRAIEELRVSAATAGLPRERCEEVLQLVGLEEAARKRVGQYSLGMRQRLGLAQALLGDPEVLLLDEPANGLDPEGITWVRQLLRHLAEQGRTILVSSHLLGEISRLADEVMVIRRGRLVANATVAELTGAAGGGSRVRSADDAALAAALRDAGAEVEHGEAGLVVTGAAPERVGEVALAAGIALSELRPAVAELEDVFLELTAGGGIG